jgi:hypothetical protein
MTKFRASICACGAIAAQKRFVIVDKSMNGTWLNGKRLARGVEETLPPKAQIGVAEVITLQFEAQNDPHSLHRAYSVRAAVPGIRAVFCTRVAGCRGGDNDGENSRVAIGDGQRSGRMRAENQDRAYADDELGIFLVVDGLGGHAAGEKAAEMAVERRRVREELGQAGRRPRDRIRRAITAANNRICEEAAGTKPGAAWRVC